MSYNMSNEMSNAETHDQSEKILTEEDRRKREKEWEEWEANGGLMPWQVDLYRAIEESRKS